MLMTCDSSGSEVINPPGQSSDSEKNKKTCGEARRLLLKRLQQPTQELRSEAHRWNSTEPKERHHPHRNPGVVKAHTDQERTIKKSTR